MKQRVTYRARVEACSWWLIGLSVIGGSIAWLIQSTIQGALLMVLLAVVAAFAGIVMFVRLAQSVCISATFDDGRLCVRQLTGYRYLRLADVKVITPARYADGPSSSAYTIHHTGGRATVFGSSGRALIDAMISVEPRIHLIASRSWLRNLWPGDSSEGHDVETRPNDT